MPVPDEYVRYWGGVQVNGHRFALTAGRFPTTPATFAANGLVEVGPGGVLVRTGRPDGEVQVWVTVQPQPPDEIDLGSWDEIVEISWTAPAGPTTVRGADRASTSDLAWIPRPAGDYRVRVHATGRDGPSDREAFELVLWPEAASLPVVHKSTDRLGHRLRGEPEPPVVPRAEAAYDWIEAWEQEFGACITLVTERTEAEVLAVLGARTDRPGSVDKQDFGAVVGVGTVGDAVLAIEPAGSGGYFALALLSRRGRAASFFWNVNALTCFGFSRAGTDLAGVCDWSSYDFADITDPEALSALDGLDFADSRHRYARALLAMARFTGVGFGRDDVLRIEERDVFYPLGGQDS